MRADPAAYYFAVSHGLRVDAKNLWPTETPLKENNGGAIEYRAKSWKLSRLELD